MRPRTRTLLRWSLGTLVFGAAVILLDVSLFHFWHLRRPRTAPAEWHLRIALGTGLSALVLLAWGARLVRRWTHPAGPQTPGKKEPDSAAH